MAEHLTRNEKVVGSIPTISSNKEVTTKVVTSLLGSAHLLLLSKGGPLRWARIWCEKGQWLSANVPF